MIKVTRDIEIESSDETEGGRMTITVTDGQVQFITGDAHCVLTYGDLQTLINVLSEEVR